MCSSIWTPARFKKDIASMALLGGLVSNTLHAFTEETVFFDVPNSLITEEIPDATGQLLAVQEYPIDPARLTLVGQVYVPDPNDHGPGPYPSVIVLHGSGGVWSNDLIPSGLASQFEEWGGIAGGSRLSGVLSGQLQSAWHPWGFCGATPSL